MKRRGTTLQSGWNFENTDERYDEGRAGFLSAVYLRKKFVRS